jgi:hypothetical protein
MATSKAIRHKPRNTQSTYRRHALAHPVHAIWIAVPVIIALSLASLLPLLLLATGEAFVLLALPRFSRFQRAVDLSLERIERAKAAVLRSTLIARMSDEHRMELEHLERLVARIRAQSSPNGEIDGSLDDDWPGLGRLLSTYVRLAIAHRAAGELFPLMERQRLEIEAAYLETSFQQATADDVRAWVAKRAEIVRNRLNVCEQSRAEREIVGHQLATISELIRWMHEESSRPDTATHRTELEEALRGWERNGVALRQLTTLCVEEPAFEPRVLEMGRLPAS